MDISDYLNDVLADWRASKDDFSSNIQPKRQWPIPFFGNPATARVATVGVNPSSGEFAPGRNWVAVESVRDWKLRLRNYFNQHTPAHPWFGPWRSGLKRLGLSYEAGTAAHFDVSYRATKAMLRNRGTDPREFRHMVDRDIAWFFQLLTLCPQLQGLLVFGPVVRADRSTESLAGFVRKSAPRHGFKVTADGGLCLELKGQGMRSCFLHEVTATGDGSITDQLAADLTRHGDELRRKIQVTGSV